MIHESGSVSIHAENIFPIIKKWLYSEKDIFIRELVSNASDAISKLRKLQGIGEAEQTENEEFRITVQVNKDQKTIQIYDNGIGMTAEEVRKYINQVAFSGAKDFVEKYKDKADENQIIGHFGLGFYSAFMVSEKVRIDTLSYQNGAEAVSWISSGGTEYEIDASDRKERGTTVTLFVGQDGEEFLDALKTQEVIEKYFSFLPYAVYLEDVSEKALLDKAEKIKKAKEENKDAENQAQEIHTLEHPQALNDTQPLWLKNPKECTEEEYKSFYNKVFKDLYDPLFWIHLNMDYPFRLQGILYFPKLRNGYEGMEGQIKLYYNQVFVADNIKEVIPDFLMALKGVVDCPDLPLNVSRSFLQNDGYVNKIATHITKKVADKLVEVFEKERDSYNQYWDDINPFVKYGCIKESKFYDRAKDILVYKTTDDSYVTLKEYLEAAKEKHENKVFYVSDTKQQSQYIRMFKESGLQAVMMHQMIDQHFMQTIEMKESGIRFQRIDSDISDILKDSTGLDEAQTKEMQDKLEQIFRDAAQDEKLKVKLEGLKSRALPCMIVQDEYMRRLADMNMLYGGGNAEMKSVFAGDRTLVVNSNSPMIQNIVTLHNNGQKEAELKLVCQHLFDIASLSHENLAPEAMHRFIERNHEILQKLVQLQNEQ